MEVSESIKRFERETMDLMSVAAYLKIHPQSTRRLYKQRQLSATEWHGTLFFSRKEVEKFSKTYNGRPGRPAQI